jgi:hypothetical protein
MGERASGGLEERFGNRAGRVKRVPLMSAGKSEYEPLQNDTWRRFWARTDDLCHRLRELAKQGRTRDAVDLLRRLLQHRRLAPAVLTSPYCGRLPWLLVWHRSGGGDAELREVILAMRPQMSGYGRWQADQALQMLGDESARERLGRLAEQRLTGGREVGAA